MRRWIAVKSRGGAWGSAAASTDADAGSCTACVASNPTSPSLSKVARILPLDREGPKSISVGAASALESKRGREAIVPGYFAGVRFLQYALE